jgi:hypothetical protein
MKKHILRAILGVFTTCTTLYLGAENKPFFNIQIPFTDDTTYIKELKAWHQKRIEGLKSENGWLNLAGLFWLQEGKNTFGTDRSNQIVFPKGKGADFIGTFTLDSGVVTVEIDAKAQVEVNKERVEKLKLFPSDKSIVLQSGSLRWFIIKRGNKYGVRLRDLDGDELKQFTDIQTFPIDKKWVIKAHLEKGTVGKIVEITDVLGNKTPQKSAGTLVFTVNKKVFKLDAVSEGEELFIIFADATSGKETYGAGRFLYANAPDAEGNVLLDFNKAVNPPCAFTAFATCPLPPKQNRLAIGIEAGEKNYGNH